MKAVMRKAESKEVDEDAQVQKKKRGQAVLRRHVSASGLVGNAREDGG